MSLTALRYIAVLQTNQTVGRPLSNNAGWTLGRAYIDVASATWTAVFPKDGVEWNTSHLVAPAQFSILGHGDYVDDNGAPGSAAATAYHLTGLTLSRTHDSNDPVASYQV